MLATEEDICSVRAGLSWTFGEWSLCFCLESCSIEISASASLSPTLYFMLYIAALLCSHITRIFIELST